MREDGLRTCFTLGKLTTKGGVLLYDDMEGVLKWESSSLWSPAGVMRASAHAYHGNYGIGVSKSRRTNGSEWFHVARTFVRRAVTGFFEVSALYRLSAGSPTSGYRLLIHEHKENVWRAAGIQWTIPDGKFKYLDSDGIWVNVPGSPPGLNDDGWHRLWFRVEFERGIYLAAGADSRTFEIGGEACRVISWSYPDVAKIEIGLLMVGLGTVGMSVDEVLVREV